ncbi:MAG: bifunctional heptose 7-phosphate kinase/heptose 1-phosphate adenyltransferase [bacterium]
MAKPILVIGDICLDEYRYGLCRRICPEAPVPVFEPVQIQRSYGMAHNVYNNIKSLGGNVLLEQIPTTNIPTKTRFVDQVSNQILLRVDENDRLERIKGLDKQKWELYSAVVISDYNKGYLHEEDIEYISKKHPITFMDTKKKISGIGGWASNIKFIKINEKEYNENINNLEFFDNTLIVTLGDKGANIRIHNYDINEFEWFHVPLETEHAVRDLSGAGDTFLAGLVVHYMKNYKTFNAVKFANKAASYAVSKKGVVAVKLEEINK